jgi:hypothetical protein
MIDLDPALTRWADEHPEDGHAADWDEGAAHELAQRLAGKRGLRVSWEPGDEEWIRLAAADVQGMLSTRFPLALVTPPLSSDLHDMAPAVVVVEITGFLTEDLRADPHLLRATVLPAGWAEDFDPEAFCANDLFVESV